MARLCKEMGISDNFLANLKANKIFTVSDYIQEETEKLANICNTSFKEVLEVRQQLITNFAALPVNGASAYQQLLANSALISSGIEKLDELLGGGFLTGTVTELCGVSGDGKTQLCVAIAANITATLKQAVHYVDTKNDFSAHRVLQILRSRNLSEVDCKSALEKIQVIKINSIYELMSYLHSLRKSLSDEEILFPRAVIIDAVPPLYFPLMSSDTNQGFGLLNHVMTTIKSIATEYHMLFLVVNLASSYVNSESAPADKEEEEEKDQVVADVRPMLGRYWLHAPHTRLLVSKLNTEDSHRLVRVLKSTSLPLGKSCVVNISTAGVV
ncbi:DNA repair protein RAD51 homolog 4 [Macrosteles quadrilineatus]|uniref:DNA repair protein RAD51 homolog 4 n=1 Tax=Macrosteles quadrilineatus TaxID=74068 RepID=UPI0023E174E8|nr:DNA repair protein RAD51 homolog 4 [Macrosteles quadrilineatus]